jgi:acetyl/propionyl-CoA carboxylase alpha subunit
VRYRVDVGGRTLQVDLESTQDGALRASVDGTPCDAQVATGGDRLRLRIGATLLDLVVERRPGKGGDEIVLHGRGATLRTRVTSDRDLAAVRAAGASSGAAAIRAPMPGRVVAVLVEKGASVAAGAPLVVVEAMKMENELRAPSAGTVKDVFVRPGQNVEGGEELIRIG